MKLLQTKLVLKLDVLDKRTMQKAMKIVSSLPGVDSVGIDMKDKKLTVTGDVDPVLILQKLRKICHTEIISGGPTRESRVEKMEFLKIPLSEITKATNNFDKKHIIGSGGFGRVYKAELEVLDIQRFPSIEGEIKDEVPKIRKNVAVKRMSGGGDEKDKQKFFKEVEVLASCKHPNIISLLGFCVEDDERILVFEFASNGSLGDYLSYKVTNLTWRQRLQICLDIAYGIDYLHTNMDGKPTILHRDIKSDNILLAKDLKAKVSDFGLSALGPMNYQHSTIYTKNIAGTEVYMDPEYKSIGILKKQSDIYSFGVVLFEVLSGSLAYDSVYTNENNMGLASIARRCYNERKLKQLIDLKVEEDDDHIFTLNRGPNQDSFDTFSKIAYQCLAETQDKRPTMEVIIKQLQKALNLQGETIVLLRFALDNIKLATENFAETYSISLDTNSMVYKAEVEHFDNSLFAREGKNDGKPSKKRTTVAIKRITNRNRRQGNQEFFDEFEMRTSYKHPNVVSLLGFCDEEDENILVYEYASHRSLDDYLKDSEKTNTFTWIQRLHICLGIARGLNHIHTKMLNTHGDIKSANILLDKNGEAKIAYFGISKLHPTNQEIRLKVYEDPEYEMTGKLDRESDIYSFGIVLFEIFCGRVAYDPVYIKENDKGLAPVACQCLDDGATERIMDPKLKEEIGENISTSNIGPNQTSLDTYLKIAYQCLGEAAKSRATMEMVIHELEQLLNFNDPKTH